MTGRLSGKVAVITGACGGIGRAAATGFALEGARVIAFDLREDSIGSLVDELGADHHGVAVDVREESRVEAAFASVAERYGKLDILFNCAGVQIVDRDAPVDALDLETWQTTLATNLTGTFLCSKYALRQMLNQNHGSIINCGSPTGLSGRGWRYHAYSASKGGISALTKAMAAAYGPLQVRVNCLVPGPVRTGLTEAIFDAGSEQLQELVERTALRRLGEPKDLVGAAVFLASDESTYVTGATLIVDGGLLIT